MALVMDPERGADLLAMIPSSVLESFLSRLAQKNPDAAKTVMMTAMETGARAGIFTVEENK
jgi:hypothetical protein